MQRRRLAWVFASAVALPLAPGCVCVGLLASSDDHEAGSPAAQKNAEPDPIDALAVADGFVYASAGRRISRTPALGGATEGIFEAAPPAAAVEVVGADASAVYFTELEGAPFKRRAPRLRRADRRGGATSTLAEGANLVAVVVDAAQIYFLDVDTNVARVRVVAKTGGAVTTLVAAAGEPTSSDAPRALAASRDDLFWLVPNKRLRTLTDTCSVARSRKSGGGMTTVSTVHGGCGSGVYVANDVVRYAAFEDGPGNLKPGSTTETEVAHTLTLYEAPAGASAAPGRLSTLATGIIASDETGFVYGGGAGKLTFIPASGPPGRSLAIGDASDIQAATMDASAFYVATARGGIRRVPR